MENKGSFAELALAGVARMRDRDCDFRGRVSALDEGFAAKLDAFMNEKHDYYVLGE